MPDRPTPELEGSLAIVSPLGGENVMGRALALAELAERVVERVFVVAPDDGPLWPAAGRWPTPVHRADRAADLPAAISGSGIRWVWVAKPLRRGWELGAGIAAAHPGAALVLDVDDDDEALSREFVRASLGNRIRVNRLRQLHPARVAATRRRALERADGLTVASRAVAEQVGITGAVRIPHPRPVAATRRSRPPHAGGEKHVGFFGTVRRHKGVESIGRLLADDPSLVLHVFAGSGGALAGNGARIVEHPGDESWDTLFDSVDAVMLPQHRSRGGDAQLPAKLIDAMRFGVPVMASPTTAIREVAGDSVLYVDDWSDLGQVRAGLEACLERGPALGEAARARFEGELSLEATVPALRGFLEMVGKRPDDATRGGR